MTVNKDKKSEWSKCTIKSRVDLELKQLTNNTPI